LNPVVNFASSLMSLRAEHVIYVAQHIRNLSYFKAKNYSIIPCGVPMEEMIITPKVEARKQLGWDLDMKYILFGGAFENKRKNFELLKGAIDKLQMTNDKFQIACVEMKGLTRSQCVLRMCACDLFALPSHSEGSPQALKEAMAVNCPCLATDIADVRELFGDEPGHWILRNPRKTHERWDGDEKSLDEMVELLKEALAFERRTKGRQRILELELSNEQVAKRIVEIYRMVI
jgi:glycosyltransferase involved in cell wall biosynthesis